MAEGTAMSEAERVCAEAYQVVGCLLSDVGLFDTPQAQKILDNLSQARMVHSDVLPWPSIEGGGCGNDAETYAEKPKEKPLKSTA